MSIPLDYPQEYIDGQVEFFYLDFFVSPDVLIPRLETESLVRRVLSELPSLSPDVLVDIGTGSGIIPISIAKNSHIPQIIGLDISEWALAIAQKNAAQHQIPLTLAISDLLSHILQHPELVENKRIVLTANLPYIKADDWENMSQDTHYEPELALFGGPETGFELYEALFAQIEELLSLVNTQSLTLFLEMGYDQSDLALVAAKSREWPVELFRDPAGIPRFAKMKII